MLKTMTASCFKVASEARTCCILRTPGLARESTALGLLCFDSEGWEEQNALRAQGMLQATKCLFPLPTTLALSRRQVHAAQRTAGQHAIAEQQRSGDCAHHAYHAHATGGGPAAAAYLHDCHRRVARDTWRVCHTCAPVLLSKAAEPNHLMVHCCLAWHRKLPEGKCCAWHLACAVFRLTHTLCTDGLRSYPGRHRQNTLKINMPPSLALPFPVLHLPCHCLRERAARLTRKM